MGTLGYFFKWEEGMGLCLGSLSQVLSHLIKQISPGDRGGKSASVPSSHTGNNDTIQGSARSSQWGRESTSSLAGNCTTVRGQDQREMAKDWREGWFVWCSRSYEKNKLLCLPQSQVGVPKLPSFGNDEQSCSKHPCTGFCVDVRFQPLLVNAKELDLKARACFAL